MHPFQLERGTVIRCSKISSFPPVTTVVPWEMSGRHSLFFIWRWRHELVGRVRTKLELFLVLKFYLNQAESENYKMCCRPTINNRAVRVVNIGCHWWTWLLSYAGSLFGAFSPLLFLFCFIFIITKIKNYCLVCSCSIFSMVSRVVSCFLVLWRSYAFISRSALRLEPACPAVCAYTFVDKFILRKPCLVLQRTR